jgi:hypothetical protein
VQPSPPPTEARTVLLARPLPTQLPLLLLLYYFVLAKLQRQQQQRCHQNQLAEVVVRQHSLVGLQLRVV